MIEKMKLSKIFDVYDLSIKKDTNGNFYVKDNANYFQNLKKWSFAGNDLLSVIDTIPNSLIESEINDIFDGYISGEAIANVLKTRNVPETAEEAVDFLEVVKRYLKTIKKYDEETVDVEDKLTLLRAIADPEKYVEDDILNS